MKIEINTMAYDVPEEEEVILLRHIQNLVLAEYAKLDEQWKLIIKPIAREVLRRMENAARKKHGDEKALMLRPAKKQDPVVHLSFIMILLLQEAMKSVTIGIRTNNEIEHHTVAALSCTIENQGETGRQVAFNGNIGLRENDRVEIP